MTASPRPTVIAPALEMRGITKRYPMVGREVELVVDRGESHPGEALLAVESVAVRGSRPDCGCGIAPGVAEGDRSWVGSRDEAVSPPS